MMLSVYFQLLQILAFWFEPLNSQDHATVVNKDFVANTKLLMDIRVVDNYQVLVTFQTLIGTNLDQISFFDFDGMRVLET